MRSAVVRQLERRVEELTRSPSGPGSARSPVSTGLPALDGLLPEGGLPRGRPVEWSGPRSCGKTALLRITLSRLLREGEPVAVVDGGHTLYAPDWAGLADEGLLWVVRPGKPREALWCADLLLRSGAFGAVTLDPGEEACPGFVLSRGTAVRLQRLAEESGAIWIVQGGLPLAAVRLRFRPARIRPLRALPFGPFLPPVRPVWVGVAGRVPGEEVPVLCPRPADRTLRRAARDRKGPR